MRREWFGIPRSPFFWKALSGTRIHLSGVRNRCVAVYALRAGAQLSRGDHPRYSLGTETFIVGWLDRPSRPSGS